MPTLLFRGIRDVLPASVAERAALLIPRSKVVTLDAGHFIPLDKPKEVAACLLSFFAENHTAMDVAIRARKNRKPGAFARTKSAEPLSLEGHRSLAVIHRSGAP